MKRRSSQFIDIVIADPSEVAELEHEAARDIFRARQHQAFIEVKWYPRAASRREAISLTSRASRCSHSATA